MIAQGPASGPMLPLPKQPLLLPVLPQVVQLMEEPPGEKV